MSIKAALHSSAPVGFVSLGVLSSEDEHAYAADVCILASRNAVGATSCSRRRHDGVFHDARFAGRT
jgi:hypothetical protein